jgi:hypothetical protein
VNSQVLHMIGIEDYGYGGYSKRTRWPWPPET